MTLGKTAMDLYPILLNIINGIMECMDNGRSEEDVKRVHRLVTNTIDKDATPPNTQMKHLQELFIEEGYLLFTLIIDTSLLPSSLSLSSSSSLSLSSSSLSSLSSLSLSSLSSLSSSLLSLSLSSLSLSS